VIEILTEIAKLSPMLGLLIVGIIYFFKKEKGYKTEIGELHKELRDAEKENLTALYQVTNFMDKMLESDKTKNQLLLKEIETMRNSIENKIESLK
jgi:hypothetical protein